MRVRSGQDTWTRPDLPGSGPDPTRRYCQYSGPDPTQPDPTRGSTRPGNNSDAHSLSYIYVHSLSYVNLRIETSVAYSAIRKCQWIHRFCNFMKSFSNFKLDLSDQNALPKQFASSVNVARVASEESKLCLFFFKVALEHATNTRT